MVTCSDGDHRGNVSPIVFLDDEKSLTLAFVYVSADLFVGFVTSSCWTYAREATQSVAALAARTILKPNKISINQVLLPNLLLAQKKYGFYTYRLMHITFINIPANSISVRMEPRVADTLVAWLQVLAGAVRTDARDHGTLVDVSSSVVFTRAFRTEDVVLLASMFRTLLASDTPT